MGMKTNYYYRTLGASQIEKSTLDAKKFGFTQKRTYNTDTNTTEFLENKKMIEQKNDLKLYNVVEEDGFNQKPDGKDLQLTAEEIMIRFNIDIENDIK